MTPTAGTVALVVLSLLVLVLAALLALHAGQRRRLSAWLEHPQDDDPPDGIGIWRGIFRRLQQLRKEERRQRAALIRSQERFRLAVETLPDGVILLDRDARIEWLNAAAAAHLGLDRERDIGTLIEQLIRQTAFVDYLNDFRAGRAATPVVLSRNDEPAQQTLSLLLLSFADGGALLLLHDISDITRAETTRRDFIANVSHELRTPLTVIVGFLEQLLGEDAPTGEQAQRFLALMNEQAQRMNRLVADLLTLSRLENATAPPPDERVDVPALLDSLLAEARALSGGRHVIELGAVAPDWLLGSGDELRSAFGNLVSNAVRYTPAGGTITLSWNTGDEAPAFAVSDTGIGIPAEHLSRLAERFYRVDKGRSAATGGTGLGLAIVKHVLARHQGSLSIRSRVGQGSTFAACLPGARLFRAEKAQG